MTRWSPTPTPQRSIAPTGSSSATFAPMQTDARHGLMPAHELEHPALAVGIDHVDRKAHPEHVDRARRDPQALVVGQAGAAEEALRALPQRRCQLAPLADHRPAFQSDPGHYHVLRWGIPSRPWSTPSSSTCPGTISWSSSSTTATPSRARTSSSGSPPRPSGSSSCRCATSSANETADLVELASAGRIDHPRSRLGRHLAAQRRAARQPPRRAARLLVAQARVPRRVARPPAQERPCWTSRSTRAPAGSPTGCRRIRPRLDVAPVPSWAPLQFTG